TEEGEEAVVALVNGEPITRGAWLQAAALDRAMSRLAEQPTPSPEATLTRLVSERLVLRAAQEAGLTLPPTEEAETWITDWLAQLDLDETVLEEALAQVGLSRAELTAAIRRLLLVAQAQATLPPDGDVEAWLNSLYAQAEVSVLRPLAAAPPSAPPPTPVPAAPPTVAPQVGASAPDFSLQALDGSTYRLSALRGRPVILYFWATWCPACQGDLSLLQETYRRYAPQGLIVLAVDLREGAGTVQPIVQTLDLTFPILLDPAATVGEKRYQVRALPTTLFLRPDGLITARHVGPLSERLLEDVLTALITTGREK
ncbi:MAG: hypothetical protein D6759_06965, partial [Chloroflexi bacterium]